MCRAMAEGGGRRCNGRHGVWTRRKVVDAAFDDVDGEDERDDRVPPHRLTAENLARLSTHHLAVVADAWDPVDPVYATTVRDAHAVAVAHPEHPSDTECHAVFRANNTGSLLRQVRGADGSNARIKNVDNWRTVVSHDGHDYGRDRAYGVGLMYNPVRGARDGAAYLAYRVTSRVSSTGETQHLVTGRTGNTPAEVLDAAGFDAFDRAVVGLPTGDAHLDGRAPGWHYAADTLHVIESAGPTGPTYLSDLQVGDRVVTTDGSEHTILTVQDAGLSRRITTCAPTLPVISAHTDTMVEARGHGGCATCAASPAARVA